jgi:hypothetical protein
MEIAERTMVIKEEAVGGCETEHGAPNREFAPKWHDGKRYR